MGSRASVAVRSIAAVLAAGGTAGTAAQQAGKWSGSPSWVLWSCIAVPGAVAITEQVRLIRAERKAIPSAKRQEAVERALVGALLEISDVTDYNKWGIGVTAWVVRRHGLWRTPRLERLARRRFTDRPPPSKITWTKGKGIIGLCWELEAEVHRDLRKACEKYPDGNITPERFDATGGDLRQGMSLEEFRTMIGRYGEVLAVPMKDKNGVFLGCVAVDVPIDYCDLKGLPRLGGVAVRHVAATTAAVLAQLVGDE